MPNNDFLFEDDLNKSVSIDWPCEHCQQPERLHQNRKCLYASTTYKPGEKVFIDIESRNFKIISTPHQKKDPRVHELLTTYQRKFVP
jgi:hypothetical protein